MEYIASRRFRTIDEVMALLADVEGKTFREIDSAGRLSKPKSGNAKGVEGQIIEESVLGYAINSDKLPDIQVGDELYELKVTPLRHLQRGPLPRVSAKERLVIDIINYLALPEEEFGTSTFWTKAERMIVVYYYDDRTDTHEQMRADCTILGSFVFRYEPDDLSIIRKDWEFIRNKVSAGYADRLSESDTNYLAASTKGSTAATSLRPAPAPAGSGVSTIRAKQRAFSYKPSFMTTVAHRVLAPDGTIERLELSPNQDLADYVRLKIGGNSGKTVAELADEIGVPVSSSKSFNQRLVLHLLGTTGRHPESIEQFAAAGVTQVKVSVIYDDGLPEQDMSFPALTQEEWNELADASIEWEDSLLYRFFEENKFCIAVFQGCGRRRRDSPKERDMLIGGFLWNMPESDIEDYVHPVWDVVHRLMVNSEPTYFNVPGMRNRLPGIAFNHVFHMRPHGRVGRDVITLPNGESITKQSWWLDRHYIAKIIENNLHGMR